MRKIIIFTVSLSMIVMTTPSSLLSQKFSQNTIEFNALLNYWYLRDRLKYFVVPGTELGQSQISSIRNRWDNGEAKTTLDYGQHCIYFGYYLGVLATEYRLLRGNNRINEALQVQTDVVLALDQFVNYLDRCEVKWYNKQEDSWDGFFVRWDMTANDDPNTFWNTSNIEKLNQGLKEDHDIWTYDHFGDFLPGHPGYAKFEYDRKPQAEPMSQDEAIGVLLGLSLVYTCMPDSPARSTAKVMAHKIIGHISSNNTWRIRDPNGDLVPLGNDATLYAYGFASAGAYFGFDICNYIDCSGLPMAVPWCEFPFFQLIPPEKYIKKISWDQIIQPIIWGPGNTSEASMELTLAAIGDSWQDPAMMCVNTTPDAMNVKAQQFDWEPFYFLLYNVLHPENEFNSSVLPMAYNDVYGSGLCEGSYFYSVNQHPPNGWASSYRWHSNISQQNNGYWVEYANPAFYGNYNSLDYMLLYNLLAIVLEDNYNISSTQDYHPYNDISLKGVWPSPEGYASVDNPAHLIGIETISSEATLMNIDPRNIYNKPGNLTFEAGDVIYLVPGFNVELGATFHASIKSPIVCTDFNQNTEGFGEYITFDNTKGLDGLQSQFGFANNYNVVTTNTNRSNTDKSSSVNSFSNVLVYPNPTEGKINIDIVNLSPKDIISTFITNSSSMLNIEVKIISDKNEIDLSNFQSGIYFLKILTSSDCFTFKIIKI